MTTNPLMRSIRYAEQMTRDLGRLYNRAGNSTHPRGVITSLYRSMRQSMSDALQRQGTQGALDVLNGFMMAVKVQLSELMNEAESLGVEYFNRQAEAYGVMAAQAVAPVAGTAYRAAAARVDLQMAQVRAMLESGIDEVLILGDDERMGVLQPSPVIRDTAQWIVEAAMIAFLSRAEHVVSRTGQRVYFDKQAVAGLDERTTDCCLQVHAQIQPLTGKFQLTGTPRFADEMTHSPFHWHCRTSIVMYLREFDDGLTAQLRQGADTILSERAAGGSGYRHPADAYA